ncbi:MAG TPA: transglycosylase domain-containing protein, partial [Pyrinomonadaceae bacterium]|nr:transglycosylase domain-containing protein [Pyrinomonadaceae bacterium]
MSAGGALCRRAKGRARLLAMKAGMAIEVKSIEEGRPRSHVRRIKNVREALARLAAARKRRIIFRSVLAASALLVVATTIFFIYSYNYYAGLVDARLKSGFLTSRAGIYAAPRTLRAGQSLSPEALVEHLRRAGYIESSASDAWSGSFIVTNDGAIEIHPRRSEKSAPTLVHVLFNNRGQIKEITGDMGVTLDSYALEPEILTTDAAMKSSKRAQLSFEEIPPLLLHAIISIEDRRFFENSGVDIWGVGRALLRNATDDDSQQGGSTITQQLVKNSFLTPERTLRRKFAEAMTAFALERRLSKQDIFALYCNEIYLGQRGAMSVRGVGQAASVYFGKELKDLTLPEAATIAGMIQSPNRYAPDRHQEAATARRNVVLGAMARDGFITNEEAHAAAQSGVAVAPLDDAEGSTAPYFVDYVNRTVEARLGATAKEDERSARVYTTIDLDLQQAAETAVRRQLERLDKVYQKRGVRPQAALVALDPRTGDVLAMIGGRNYA